MTEALQQAWEAEQERAKCAGDSPNLWRAIYASRRWAFWCSAFFLLLEAIVMLSKPVLLRFFISWLQGAAPPGASPALQQAAKGGVGYGYGFAVGLAMLDCVQLVLHHTSFYVAIHEGWRLKTAIVGVVYRKMLRLGSRAAAAGQTGRIVTIVSNDAQRYEEFTGASDRPQRVCA
jgi:ABC-type multidrug transport system fused ATPase/permease subunit